MSKNLPQQLKEILSNLFHQDNLSLAISTGTPGPFRKITVMIMDSNGNALGYAKIGETPLAIERIKNEANILRVIVDGSWVIGKENINKGPEVMGHGIKDYELRIRIPQILYEGENGNAYMVIQSPAPFDGKSGDKYFNEDYRNILQTLMKNTSVSKKFNESDFYKRLKEGVENYPLSYKDLLLKGLEYIENSIDNREITFALSHGDFAPWNMLWSKDKKNVFLYDWESANLEAPASIDLIHFLFQAGFLIKKLRNEKLLKYIIQSTFFSYFLLPPEILLLLYCLHMAITEDQPQQLSPTAVERRQMIKRVIGNERS